MAESGKKRLNKNLKLFDVYAVATGATLSAGFFLLPGIAAQEAGPAMILAYIIAAIPLIPATFSIVELSTAMPRAGGVYYFLDRGLGPLFGTIGGFGTWLSLVLKVSFALVGMGYYIALFVPQIQGDYLTWLTVGLAIALGLLNLGGSKKSGKFQSILVVSMLALLILYIGSGSVSLNTAHFQNFAAAGFDKIFATAGMVYISYVGVTKVASLSEEVQDPEKNLPRGIFLSLGTSILIYALGTTVMVGTLSVDELKTTMTPVAASAEKIFGFAGIVAAAIAAILAFTSVANAGTMSASRYPMALSRDQIIPNWFQRLSSSGIPINSIFFTVGTIILILIFLDPLKIAKLASAFQMVMFSLACLTVIVMRESRIESYDPGYKSPFYPWIQIFGIIAPAWFIFEMGWMPTLFSLVLVMAGALWYFYYAKIRVRRNGAIYHIFERLGRQRYDGLDYELREILREKGLREDDPFNELILKSPVIDLDQRMTFEEVVEKITPTFCEKSPHSPEEVNEGFMSGSRIGATPVSHGVALPHFRSNDIDSSLLVIVRSPLGIDMGLEDSQGPKQEIFASFFLISPLRDPAQHLRILAQIAERVDDENFASRWKNAQNEQDIKETLVQDERSLALDIQASKPSSILIGKQLRELRFPEGCLVALLRRGERVIVPRGTTQLEEGDRLTIIGEVEGMREVRKLYL
jgi:amino acid transporter/mannitol/fructose-specific phosphotransferase system IIA component (Ntr-type)